MKKELIKQSIEELVEEVNNHQKDGRITGYSLEPELVTGIDGKLDYGDEIYITFTIRNDK